MKKFVFRLETLLRLRKVREGNLIKNLEVAAHKKNYSQEQERMLQSQIDSLMDEMRQKREQGNFDRQETYSQLLMQLNVLLIDIRQNLLAQQIAIEKQQQQLKIAAQERKLIEKIREKQYSSWRTNEIQSEGALLDEISLQKSHSIE